MTDIKTALPPLPNPCEYAYVEGRAMQGSEYRRLSGYDPDSAMFSPDQMRAYAEAAVLAASATTLPIVENGENQAIRMFLMRHAGSDAVTTKQMREHLTMAGYEGCWPDWANEDQHLTKAGAQSWIRHLISLESDVLQSLTEETEQLGLYAAPVEAQDAVDAKRYRKLRATTKAIRNDEGTERIEVTPDDFDKHVDAMQASQSPQDQVKP